MPDEDVAGLGHQATITRRSLLRTGAFGLGLAGVGPVLAACSSGGSSASTSPTRESVTDAANMGRLPRGRLSRRCP